MLTQESPYLGWPGKKKLGVWNLLALNFYWFPNNILCTGLLIIIMPAKVLQLVGARASTGHLSEVQLIGDVVAIIAAPLFGAISDHWITRMGRRRPQMIVGLIGNVFFFLMMGFAHDFSTFLVGFAGVQLFNNISGSAFQGLIPDLVPPQQRGQASAFFGLYDNAAVLVGALLATVLAGMGYWYAASALLVLGVAVTIFFVQEPVPPKGEPFKLGRFFASFLIGGPGYRDYWWVFVTRFLVMMGLYVLEYFLSYYLRFVLHVRNPQPDILIILAVLTVAALVAAVIGGHVSDRIKRRRILVSTAGILMGACSLVFVFLDSLTAIFVAAALFGVGYGAFKSVDLALVVDTLPSTAAAKDMGIWGISTTLPQSLSATIGLAMAALVIPAVGVGEGYRLMFAVTFVLFVLGSILVWQIRKVA